jgi:hypothetical protein
MTRNCRLGRRRGIEGPDIQLLRVAYICCEQSLDP